MKSLKLLTPVGLKSVSTSSHDKENRSKCPRKLFKHLLMTKYTVSVCCYCLLAALKLHQQRGFIWKVTSFGTYWTYEWTEKWYTSGLRSFNRCFSFAVTLGHRCNTVCLQWIQAEYTCCPSPAHSASFQVYRVECLNLKRFSAMPWKYSFIENRSTLFAFMLIVR